MPLIVPTEPDTAEYVQRTQLDGVDYVLRFAFNQRIGRWHVDLMDQDEQPIATGVLLPTAWPIARLVRDPRRHAGQLIVVDQESGVDPVQDTQDASLCNLGERFLLMYFEAAEL